MELEELWDSNPNLQNEYLVYVLNFNFTQASEMTFNHDIVNHSKGQYNNKFKTFINTTFAKSKRAKQVLKERMDVKSFERYINIKDLINKQFTKDKVNNRDKTLPEYYEQFKNIKL